MFIATVENVEEPPVQACILTHGTTVGAVEKFFRYIVQQDLDKSGLVMMLASTSQQEESGCQLEIIKPISNPAPEYHEIHITA